MIPGIKESASREKTPVGYVLPMISGKKTNGLEFELPGFWGDHEITLMEFDINGMNFSFCFIASTSPLVIGQSPIAPPWLELKFFKAMEENINFSKKLLITETVVFSKNKKNMNRFPVVIEKEPGFFG
jgi:hypothetical protein